MFLKCKSVLHLGLVASPVFTFWLYQIVFPALHQNSHVTRVKQTHHFPTDQKLSSNTAVMKARNLILYPVILRQNASIIEKDAGNASVAENLPGILNSHPFTYIINEPNICHNKDIFLIVYVHTAPTHYKRRMVIRQTWGNQNHYDKEIRVIFMMGKTADPLKMQNSVYFESEQYGDIVQEDFLDTYRNLTYKGVAGLKWISKYCRHAKFVLKTDDNIFVNMFTLLRHFKSRDKLRMNRGLLMCLVWYKMHVMRKGKWKVRENEFKDSIYPTYCSGSAFSMSTDVAVSLYKASFHVPFFWIDDFYITGLLPLKVGIKHTQFMSTYILDGHKLEEKFTGSQWYTYIFSHVHDLNKIQSVWSQLLVLDSGATLPNFKYTMPLAHLPHGPK